MANEQNVTGYYSGDDLELVVTIQDENGAGLDITSATVTWVLKRNINSTALVTKTVGSGIVLTTPASGIITISIDPADTAAVFSAEGKPFYHEIELTDVSGNVTTVLFGTFEVKKDGIE